MNYISFIFLLFSSLYSSVSWAALEDAGLSAAVEASVAGGALSSTNGRVNVEETGPVIDRIAVRDMDVREVIELIAEKSGLNIVTGQNVQGRSTIVLKDVEAREALRLVLEASDLAYSDDSGVIRVMTAADYAVKYGHPFGQEKTTKMVRVNFVPLKDMASLLSAVKSDGGKVVVNEETRTVILMDTQDKVRAMEALVKEADVQTVTDVITLRYARAEDVAETVRGMLTQSVGSVAVDMKTNRLTVTDTLVRVERVKRAVSEIDGRSRRVLLQAKLVHISLDDEHLGGVDWQGIVENYQNLRLRGKYDFLDGKAEDRILSVGNIAEEDFSSLLEALDTVGIVKEYPLSDIAVTGDEEVLLSVRLDDPCLTLRSQPRGAEVARESAAASVDFVLRLGIAPDGNMETSLTPAAMLRSSGGKASGVLAATGDRGVIVLGGLIATEKIATVRKIPIMGDLPILGFAFRYHNSTVRREEFAVFLTPKAAPPQSDKAERDPGADAATVTEATTL